MNGVKYKRTNCFKHLGIILDSMFYTLTRCTRGDARIFFSVLTKRICMHKTKFLMNIFKYCFKNYIKLHEFANCNSANYDVYFLTIVRLKMYFHRRQTCTKCLSKPKLVTCNLKSELKLLSAMHTQPKLTYLTSHLDRRYYVRMM